ncbi:MAG: metal ABC transporter ATP-binding protein [Brevinematia bacterium]
MKKEKIILEDITFSYGKASVFSNLSLRIFEHEFTVILGPNGAGKSTLIKLIIGILKPQKGKIIINSENRNNIFGYVPQRAILDTQFPITVEEVVLGGLTNNFGFYTRGNYKKVDEVLARFGLDKYKKKNFFHLSGGQQQRVLIARALISDPEILILDEPASNIDNENEEILSIILEELKKEKTIIVVTHETTFVEDITDRVLCLKEGKVVEHEFAPIKDLPTIFGYKENKKRVLHSCEV